jgi:hypothetical protein
METLSKLLQKNEIGWRISYNGGQLNQKPQPLRQFSLRVLRTVQNSSRPLPYMPDSVRVTVEDRGTDRTSTDCFKVYIRLLVQIEITRSITLHIVHRKTTQSRDSSYDDSTTFLKIDG